MNNPSKSKRHIAIWICLFLVIISLPITLNAGEPGRRNSLGLGATLAPVSLFAPAPPVATFKGVTLEPHVRVNGHNGMRVHVHLLVTDRVRITCLVEAIFFDSAGNQIEATKTALFRTSEGKALIVNEIIPIFQSTEYKDLQMWVPTATFHRLPRGVHDLKVRLRVISRSTLIGTSSDYAFTLKL
ncbi:MAG: hypothetical protein ABIP75_14545 [Pyrinomonadaceae bacterium]